MKTLVLFIVSVASLVACSPNAQLVTLRGSNVKPVASYGNRYSIGYLSGVISKEDQVGFIPPQTKLEKRQFMVVPSGNLRLTGPYTVEQEEAQGVARKKPVDVNTYAYSADQSPLTFRNHLTFSTDKDFRTEFTIDTKFWAADVKVLPRDQLLMRRTTNGEYHYSETIPFKKPDSFYVVLPVQ